MTSPIRVMIVDDHTMVRRGLTTFLKVFDDLELVGEAADGETAVQLCGELLPDVILMDLLMPDVDGISAIRIIRERYPAVQIIALTSFKEEALVQGALRAGAVGYLLKDVLADELAQAIRAAHVGRGTLSPGIVQAMTRADGQPAPPGHDLTERELEVLALLVAGLGNNEIAEKLVVSPATIKSHVSNILAKFGVASRTEAATIAVRQGLVK
jgi:two-component system, NarL family, response regulator LiaR